MRSGITKWVEDELVISAVRRQIATEVFKELADQGKDVPKKLTARELLTLLAKRLKEGDENG